MKLIKFIAVLLLAITSVLLGGRMLFSHDFFYLSDQGRDFLLIQDIVVNHHLTLIGTHSGLGGVFHGPLWLYLLSPIYLLGNGNPFLFAVIYAFIPVIIVFLSFFLFSKLYNWRVGLLTAFFAAFSPSIFSSIPNTIGVHFIPIISIFIFYFLILFLRGKWKYFPFLVFSTGLLFQFETAIAIGFLPVVAFIVLFNYKKIENIKNVILGGIAFILSISNFILFDLRHHFLIFYSLLGMFSGVHQKGYLYFPARIFDHFSTLKDIYFSFLFSHNVFTLILLAISFGIFVGLLKNFRNEKVFKEFLITLFFPTAVFLVFLLYPYTVWYEYVLGLTIPVFLVVSLIFEQILKTKEGKIVVSLFIIFTLIFSFSSLENLYLKHFPANLTSGSYLNQKKVADWVISDSKNNSISYFVYTPETFTYGMDYLLAYEAKKMGKNVMSDKSNNYYLIMYPGLSNDLGAHDFWKKNVIHASGNIIETKSFQGGIIVEKVKSGANESPVDPNYFQNLIFR